MYLTATGCSKGTAYVCQYSHRHKHLAYTVPTICCENIYTVISLRAAIIYFVYLYTLSFNGHRKLRNWELTAPVSEFKKKRIENT